MSAEDDQVRELVDRWLTAVRGLLAARGFDFGSAEHLAAARAVLDVAQTADGLHGPLLGAVGQVVRSQSPVQIMTVGEAADLFGVNQDTIRRWCRDGRLSGHKIGRAWKVRVPAW